MSFFVTENSLRVAVIDYQGKILYHYDYKK